MLLAHLHLVLVTDTNASDPARRASRLAAAMAAREGAQVTSLEQAGEWENPFYQIAQETQADDLEAAIATKNGARHVIVVAAQGSAALDLTLPENASLVVISGDPGHNEATLFAGSGVADLLGDPERKPLVPTGHYAAHSVAFAAFCALTALHAGQRRFGQQDRADIDVLRVMSWVNWKAAAAGSMGMAVTREGALAEWPSLPCKDGYCVFLFTERDWPAVVAMIGDERLEDERFASFKGRAAHRDEYMGVIREWVLVRSKEEIDAAFISAGVPGASVKTIGDLFSDPLVMHRELLEEVPNGGKSAKVPRLPHRIAAQAQGSPTSEKLPQDHVLPLSGVQVLDLGIITAGAGVSAVLADLGADVLKVESATYPDPFRSWAGAAKGDSPLFKFNNRNKHGLDIDLKTQEGREQFLDLARKTDVVVENFRRGVLDRLGLTFEALTAANPNIVLASIAGQGLDGPGAGHTTFGSTLEASSGFASMTCYEDGQPVVSGRNLNYPDQIICLYGAAAIAAAVSEARLAGRAMHLDISQRDAAIFQAGDLIAQVSTGTSDDAEALRASIGDTGRISAAESGSYIAQGAQGSGFTMPCCNGVELFEAMGKSAGPSFLTSPSGDLVKGFAFQFAASPMRIHTDSPTVGRDNDRYISKGA